LDENCADYIEFASTLAPATTVAQAAKVITTTDTGSELQRAIVKGRTESAGQLTEMLLQNAAPLEIVQNEIIPALDTVGRGFEQKTVYLPQLLMSAEAAKSAFSKIKAHMEQDSAPQTSKMAIVIATVKGDIHDIGKNIVKLLLENYGFSVTDLGRDVAPKAVVDAVVKTRAPLVGLSALMTTTVPAMEETIKALRVSAPWCKIMVGGAVLTADYADRIGADRYCKDAMSAVRYAESLN
jgi:5-methyltetrahydrofolate--homocysteine methyltransferase